MVKKYSRTLSQNAGIIFNKWLNHKHYEMTVGYKDQPPDFKHRTGNRFVLSCGEMSITYVMVEGYKITLVTYHMARHIKNSDA